jgi:hypothetical protein
MMGTSAVSGICRKSAADFITVDSGHDDVEQNEVRWRARGDLQRHFAIELRG